MSSCLSCRRAFAQGIRRTLQGRARRPVSQIVGSTTLRHHRFRRAFLPRKQRPRRVGKISTPHTIKISISHPFSCTRLDKFYFVTRWSPSRQRRSGKSSQSSATRKSSKPKLAFHSPPIHHGRRCAAGERYVELSTRRRSTASARFVDSVFRAGGYMHLIEHIAVHRYFMGIEQRAPDFARGAVAHWYATVYLPGRAGNSRTQHSQRVSDRTEADLYLWIMDHLYF